MAKTHWTDAIPQVAGIVELLLSGTHTSSGGRPPAGRREVPMKEVEVLDVRTEPLDPEDP